MSAQEEAAKASGDRGGQPPTVVGLIAESTVQLKALRGIAAELQRSLALRVDDSRRWELQVAQDAVPMDREGRLLLMEHADEMRQRHDCDLLVYFTDLPHLADRQPLLAEVSRQERVAIVSSPALGQALRRRTHETVLRVVARMLHGEDELRPTTARLSGKDRFQPVEEDLEKEAGQTVIELRGVLGSLRLLVGMVRINRPWRLAPALSGATAGAAAAGAFGIFYASIWAMAEALSWYRLVLISCLAIALMSAWLIGYNGLWERRKSLQGAVLYNTSTVLTVATAVTIMYVLLFVVLLLGATVVISGEYLARQLQSGSAGPVDYLALAWLAASMGIFAGALGSSWDSDHKVREATFGHREQQRRALASEDRPDEEADEEPRRE
ncbi:DUF2267 domain-containing protein [Ornithinicoccus halotolerans]|uniref:DUF2267 domain-containing protein n=1 Tax=Ornithinicoccus halotolerans TaxID=1748220 RepID=UPI0012967AE7|nr:DUF2267 domain-containing protein [Ornithinicoccus halotolerans]